MIRQRKVFSVNDFKPQKLTNTLPPCRACLMFRLPHISRVFADDRTPPSGISSVHTEGHRKRGVGVSPQLSFNSNDFADDY